MATDKRGRKLPRGIRQRGDRFEARFMINGINYSVTGATIKETQQMVIDEKYRIEHGTYIRKNTMTLDEWFEIWLEEYKRHEIKSSTIYGYRNTYRSMAKNKIGCIKVTSLTREHFRRLYNDLADEGYAKGSIIYLRNLMSGCIKQAVTNGLLLSNPVAGLKLPTAKEPKFRIALTPEQQKVFLEYSRRNWLHDLFELALRTGLRSGELRGLQWNDVDFEKRLLHVRRTIVYVDNELISGAPKTKASYRDVPLTESSSQFLQRMFSKQKPESAEELLFFGPSGKPLATNVINGNIQQVVRDIRADGIDFPQISCHVFRHTFATRAIEAGMNPQTLKVILGHSSLAITMDLYAHVMPNTKATEMQLLDEMF